MMRSSRHRHLLPANLTKNVPTEFLLTCVFRVFDKDEIERSTMSFFAPEAFPYHHTYATSQPTQLTITTMCSSTKTVDPKIIDLLNKDPEGLAHVSLEYFPPRTEQGVKNLHARMERMLTNTKCLYTDMTWGAGGSTAELSLELALHAQKTGHVSNLHLTCTNMEKDGDPIKGVHDALQEAYDGGIRNIVALRGDPQEGENEWTATKGGFTCALDLVRYIRKEFGDDFGISVAGYPEGHPNRISELSEEEVKNMSESEKSRCCTHEGITYVCKDDDYKKEMDYLKEKVDAGAGKFSSDDIYPFI